MGSSLQEFPKPIYEEVCTKGETSGSRREVRREVKYHLLIVDLDFSSLYNYTFNTEVVVDYSSCVFSPNETMSQEVRNLHTCISYLQLHA